MTRDHFSHAGDDDEQNEQNEQNEHDEMFFGWAVGGGSGGRWAVGGGRWAVGRVGGWGVGEEAAHRPMSGALRAWRAAADPLPRSLGRVPRVGGAVCGRPRALDFFLDKSTDDEHEHDEAISSSAPAGGLGPRRRRRRPAGRPAGLS